jgi:hypothetical protein
VVLKQILERHKEIADALTHGSSSRLACVTNCAQAASLARYRRVIGQRVHPDAPHGRPVTSTRTAAENEAQRAPAGRRTCHYARSDVPNQGLWRQENSRQIACHVTAPPNEPAISRRTASLRCGKLPASASSDTVVSTASRQARSVSTTGISRAG